MPYYSRYRRRTGFARYRRRYVGYRRRYRRARVGGSLTSRSRLRVRVPVQKVVTLTIPANSTDSNVATSCPYWESTSATPTGVCSAVATPLYQAYTKLFDQVKCDGVITKVAVVTPVVGSAAVSALQLLIAYDRQGTIQELENTGAPPPLTVASLFNMSSVQIRSAINNSVAKTARSCWASDLQERTVFHDCSYGANADDSVFYDLDYNADRVAAHYFVPLTMIGVRNAAAAATSAITIQILIEQVYYFTFRNPKFGASTVPSANAVMRAVDDPLAVQSLDAEERVYTRGSIATLVTSIDALLPARSLVLLLLR